MEGSNEQRLSSSSTNGPPALREEDFKFLCKSKIRISKRNRILIEKFRSDEEEPKDSPRLSQYNTQRIEEEIKNRIELARKQRKPVPNEDPSLVSERRFSGIRLEPSSCFYWFFLPTSYLRTILPEYELARCKGQFKEMVSRIPNCHEAHFGLGKMLAHEGNFEKSLHHLREALRYSPGDGIYKLWYGVLFLFTTKLTEEQATQNQTVLESFSLPCCAKRQVPTAKNNYSHIVGALKELPKNIEVYWALMELALKEILVIKEDIEPPQHYAVKIKDLDSYYGYLAWAEIYFKQRNQWDKAIAVLKELVRIEPTRPEAYIRLWLWHYRSMKTYEPAEDIIEQAFIKATDNEVPIYRVLIYLMYAKTLFKRTKIRNALELLQRQYLEHPTYPIFLYHYGKMCSKSEISKFAGVAADTLSECLRVCASDYHGGVWYWLFKAYLTARLPLDALLAAKSAVSKLHSEERKKIRFINEYMHKHKEVLIAYDKLLVLLKSPINQDKYDEVLNLCRIVKDFDPANGDYIQAKVFWKIGAQDKALKYLQERSDSTSPFLLKAHLALVSYLTKSKSFIRAKIECQKLITKTKNPSVPTFIWMKAHIKYAKILTKCDLVHKAINILKCIAKVLPPVSNHEIVYTKVLQQAKSIEDLEEAHLQTALSKDVQYEYNTYRTSMASIFSEDYLQTIYFMNKSPYEEQIDITSQVMTYETPGNEPESSPQKRGIQTFRNVLSGREPEKYATLTIETEFDEEDPDNLQSSRYLSPDSVKAFQGLSCCSDPIFLYKLGKYSAKYNCRAEDGLYALHDYKILLKFQLNITNDQRELQEAKAQFWECMIKKNDNQLSGSESFLPDLVSKLQTMGLTNKHTALTSSITKSVSKTSLE